MKCTIAVLLLGVALAQAHYVPTNHHDHHGHHATNELSHGEDYLWDDSHAEQQHKWTGPIHVPVIKHGVPTETPEVRHAKAHLEHKLAEAKSHHDYHSEEEEDYEEQKWSHHAPAHHVSEHHHHAPAHHHQHKWTGPIHVPVIKHGVPTETPEVQHAKAAFEHKLAEAKKHSGHHEDKWQHHEEHEHHHVQYHHHEPHHHHEQQHKWTGPIHVPVIKHGVPTETPEVRHAKAHLEQKLAEAKLHSGYESHEEEDKWSHHDNHHHGHHHAGKWSGPVHVPVIEHGVPTETPEVRHAKAELHRKFAEAKSHGDFHHEEHHEAHWAAAPVHHHAEHAPPHGQHRWTGPVHVPVIKHGVPTETPEVKHAKELLHAKHAEARAHPDFKDKDCDEEEAHHAAGFVEAAHGDHQTRHWSHGAHKSHY